MKNKKNSFWVILFKIIFVLGSLYLIGMGAFMAVCGGLFLFDSWGGPMNLIYFIIPGILMIVGGVFILRKIFKKSKNKSKRIKKEL